MNPTVLILFALAFSLFLAHELDAVRQAEWRILPWLKNMQDPDAFRLFTALHIPLFAFLLYLLLGGYRVAAFWIVDVFLVAHALLHLLFHSHLQNRLKSPFSLMILYSAAALAVLHMAMRAGW